MMDIYTNSYIDDDENTTESTEKMIATDAGGKFEIVLDVVKVNTNLTIERRK